MYGDDRIELTRRAEFLDTTSYNYLDGGNDFEVTLYDSRMTSMVASLLLKKMNLEMAEPQDALFKQYESVVVCLLPAEIGNHKIYFANGSLSLLALPALAAEPRLLVCNSAPNPGKTLALAMAGPSL
ncbi:hypothetical protein POM88_020033 [Heracleum sosnowskyi]|uniref:Uncharacterized protein n=1 Tax=Heracleum sosnowskyi TaxID=360622 RepID=A0AAD8IBS9_9APIA|nr:hypothetical protein POM88_020033 [Heracleum sosnowskyi]